ncbi:MAG TPA: hypothetical protein DIW47_05940 [Bacteroidetes bacterium]|nr:hypothetical protein [Bacteroidota bacterium]
MKSFKDLFIKPEAEEENNTSSGSLHFPKSENTSLEGRDSSANDNKYLPEIIDVYEKGLQSINMPGYDFYDFFVAVKAAGSQDESVYRMAFQMGRTMDASISKEKLASDAEFYLSKINEVYQSYTTKGREKLENISNEMRSERDQLNSGASQLEAEISNLRQQIINLEKKLADTKKDLVKLDDKYKPQSDTIQQKLQANDQAMEISIQKLNSVKEGILKFL